MFFPTPGPTASSPLKLLDADTRQNIPWRLCQECGEGRCPFDQEGIGRGKLHRKPSMRMRLRRNSSVYIGGSSTKPSAVWFTCWVRRRHSLTQPLTRRIFWAYGFAVASTTRNESFPNCQRMPSPTMGASNTDNYRLKIAPNLLIDSGSWLNWTAGFWAREDECFHVPLVRPI